MIKYILALSLAIPLPSQATCADKADMVFYHEEESQKIHIGWYQPCYYVVTYMDGPNKGLQELRYGVHAITSSKDSEQHYTYFIHFYNGFKVYSWDDHQRIIYTQEDRPCLEIDKDTSK